MKKVLFVCVENSCRSQMAEAFGKKLGNGVIDVYSGGSRPSGRVNGKAISSMKETGYDLTLHTSKSLQAIPQIQYDYIVTMACGDECPSIPAKKREDWDIPDPQHMEMNQFNEVRDSIKKHVIQLIEDVKISDIAAR